MKVVRLEQFGASITSLGILGSVQGQTGWDFQQPGLVKGGPAQGGGVATSLRSLNAQTVL